MSHIIKLVFIIFTPILKFLNKIHMPFSIKKIDGDFYYRNRSKIKKGHVFLTNTNGAGTNLLNFSTLNHGAIYFGRGLSSHIDDVIDKTSNGEVWSRLIDFRLENDIQDDVCYIIEATGKGVIATDLVSFMTTKDVFVCVEPTNYVSYEAADYAVNDLGLPYDYFFTEEDDARYCFELVAKSYQKVEHNELVRKVYKLLGMELYTSFLSDTFTNENWKTVIDSRIEE